MKYEQRILARSAVAVRPRHKLLTPFARHRGSIGGGTNHLNGLRQRTALAVPKSCSLQGFQQPEGFARRTSGARCYASATQQSSMTATTPIRRHSSR